MNRYADEIMTHELETSRLQRNVALVKALGLTPKRDGNQWCYLYGSDLMEGVAGFGDTVYEAAADFENNYCNESIKSMKKVEKSNE